MNRVWQFAILGILAATLSAEIILRVIETTPYLWRVFPIAEVALYGPDPDTGYALRPNIRGTWITENRTKVSTNSLGLRDKFLSFNKPPGQYRIVLLGDSFAEALQVNLDDTYQAVAEGLFAQSEKMNVEIVNLGLAGATPAVQIVRAKTKGLLFQPDAFIFMTNFADFDVLSNDTHFPAYILQPDNTAAIGYGFRDSLNFRLRTSGIGQFIYWLLDHSKLATLINNRKNQSDSPSSASTPPARNCNTYNASVTAMLRDGQSKEKIAALQAFLKDLNDLQKTASGIPVILALSNLPACTPNDRDDVLKMIMQQFKENKITIIDFDDTLERILKNHHTLAKRDLFGFGLHKGNGHLNVTGHKLYAEAITEILHSYLPQ